MDQPNLEQLADRTEAGTQARNRAIADITGFNIDDWTIAKIELLWSASLLQTHMDSTIEAMKSSMDSAIKIISDHVNR